MNERVNREQGGIATAQANVEMYGLSVDGVDPEDAAGRDAQPSRWDRNFFGNFIDEEVQADYDMDHPINNLATGYKSTLFFLSVTYTFRVIYNTPTFVNNLGGKDLNHYVYTMVAGGVLIMVVAGLTMLVLRANLDGDALRRASYVNSLLLIMITFWWVYSLIELDTPHYTALAMQTDAVVNWTQCESVEFRQDMGSYLGMEMKHSLSTLALIYSSGLQIVAMVGLPFQLATATMVCLSVIHLSIVLIAPYASYMSMPLFIMVGFMCFFTLGWMYDDHGKELWVSVQKHREQQQLLHCANTEKAQARATAFGQIVTATAHDMRTPVTAIQSGCRILQMDYSRGAVHEIPGTLTRMHAALETSLCFLDCMLLSSQLLEGLDIMAKPEVVVVRDEVDNAILCTKLCCSPVFIGVSGFVAEGVAECVISDRQCILRSMMNLLNNACQHTQTGSIEVRVSVCGTENRFLKFAVIDTGKGHDPNDLDLWKPFVSTGTRSSVKSTGIGLFVVKRQAEALGGSCGSALNPAGVGSIFWFQVPYVPTLPKKQTGGMEYDLHFSDLSVSSTFEPPAPAVGTSAGHIKSVLLIDDTKLLLELLALELQGQGFEVTQAYGAHAGLEALREKEYDVCFCDVQMSGGMNGCQLTELFREWEVKNRTGKRQNIIALTAYTSPEVATQCEVAGMQGILTKPLKMEMALEMITNFRQQL